MMPFQQTECNMKVKAYREWESELLACGGISIARGGVSIAVS